MITDILFTAVGVLTGVGILAIGFVIGYFYGKRKLF